MTIDFHAGKYKIQVDFSLTSGCVADSLRLIVVRESDEFGDLEMPGTGRSTPDETPPAVGEGVTPEETPQPEETGTPPATETPEPAESA
ncbi:MAG TPA: hypothetical protein GX702_13405, partial [Chloroflexi bacterium]|nr:hypothetical protein [Chloroflexota bacterium]